MTYKWSKYKITALGAAIFFGVITMHLCPFYGGNRAAHLVLQYFLLTAAALSGLGFGWKVGLGAAAVVVLAETGFALRSGAALTASGGLAAVIPFDIFVLAAAYFAGRIGDRIGEEQAKKAKAQADLEKAYAELGARNAEFFSAEEELRRGERLRVLGELSGELAHEIQNPLASIKGTAEILNDRCQGKCGTGEFMDILMSEIKRLRSVLDRFLDFARNQDTESPVCNAISSFEDVIRLMKHQMDKHHISLHLNAPPDGCLVRISDEQLKQVFVNLVLNSVQAMSEEGEIHAAFEQNATEVIITIRDTGPGVKDKDREKIFSPFFSTKRAGTGLGLSIVWRILTKHGGSIRLAPKTDTQKGACFIITLPRGHAGEMVVSKATA